MVEITFIAGGTSFKIVPMMGPFASVAWAKEFAEENGYSFGYKLL